MGCLYESHPFESKKCTLDQIHPRLVYDPAYRRLRVVPLCLAHTNNFEMKNPAQTNFLLNCEDEKGCVEKGIWAVGPFHFCLKHSVDMDWITDRYDFGCIEPLEFAPHFKKRAAKFYDLFYKWLMKPQWTFAAPACYQCVQCNQMGIDTKTLGDSFFFPFRRNFARYRELISIDNMILLLPLWNIVFAYDLEIVIVFPVKQQTNSKWEVTSTIAQFQQEYQWICHYCVGDIEKRASFLETIATWVEMVHPDRVIKKRLQGSQQRKTENFIPSRFQ